MDAQDLSPRARDGRSDNTQLRSGYGMALRTGMCAQGRNGRSGQEWELGTGMGARDRTGRSGQERALRTGTLPQDRNRR